MALSLLIHLAGLFTRTFWTAPSVYEHGPWFCSPNAIIYRYDSSRDEILNSSCCRCLKARRSFHSGYGLAKCWFNFFARLCPRPRKNSVRLYGKRYAVFVGVLLISIDRPLIDAVSLVKILWQIAFAIMIFLWSFTRHSSSSAKIISCSYLLDANR